jgi:hypothetical protein
MPYERLGRTLPDVRAESHPGQIVLVAHEELEWVKGSVTAKRFRREWTYKVNFMAPADEGGWY